MATYFYAACCQHDDDYDRGGTERDRRKADRSLFRNMVYIAMRREGKVRRWLLCTLVAAAYYASVRALGWHYFAYKGKA